MRLSIFLAWGILLLMLGVSLSAPLLVPYDPLTINLDNNLAMPSAQYWLGTDFLGRDVFSRVLVGGRTSLLMASAGTAFAVGVGTLFALLGFNRRGRWIIESFLDVLLALPSLLIALVMIAVLGSGRDSIALAVGIASTGAYAHTVLDALRLQQRQGYVESARSIGASPWRIVWRHLLPNALPTMIAFAGVVFSWSLLNSAALSFLGFVSDPDYPDWGVMLASGRQIFAVMPYEALAAGTLLTMTIGAVNRLTR